ncbi:MAG TPA: hypothetical protein VFE47_15515 [Tepidisphaeraceae bacterium]|jgi:hypothetical protein|nr:hypothetical protein [Tepidisphaeraceae bacterium]
MTVTFNSRRLRNLIVTAVLAVALAGYLWIYSMKLRPATFVSGWILAGFVLFLTLYNVRKKFAYFPLIKSSIWLQFHIYVGLLSMVVFTTHAFFMYGHRWHVPSGPLNVILAFAYIATALSGILGLALTRAFPSRITDSGEEVIYERIPIFVRTLRERAAELIVEVVGKTDASTLPDFYAQRLAAFFARPRYYWLHLFQSRRPLLVLNGQLASLSRYLNDDEKHIAHELSVLIKKKDALDSAWALQGTLKGWLFFHIAMTYSLLAFLAAHIVVAYAFSGGVR